MQSAKVDAMGFRLEEMKDLFLQHELRMEVQMAELNKMHTMCSATHSNDQPKVEELTISDIRCNDIRSGFSYFSSISTTHLSKRFDFNTKR